MEEPAVKARVFFVVLFAVFVVWIAYTVQSLRAEPTPPDERPAPTIGGAPVGPPTGAPAAALEAAVLRRKLRHEHRRYLQARRQVRVLAHRRWRPTVDYAIRLAAAVAGVPAWELYAVARCESTLNPYARNGRYQGLFQLGWAPFGFSPFDPVANALSAALTVRRDGSWRQWECKP